MCFASFHILLLFWSYSSCRSASCKATLAQDLRGRGLGSSCLACLTSLSLSLPCTNSQYHRKDATKNQSPSPHPSAIAHPALAVITKCLPPLPLVVRKHTNKRAISNSTINLLDFSTMGNLVLGLDPNTVHQVPMDFPDQRAD